LQNAPGISNGLRIFLLAASAGCGTVAYKCGNAALNSDSLVGKITLSSGCAVSGGSSLLFLVLAYPLGDILHNALLEERGVRPKDDPKSLQEWREEMEARIKEREAHAAHLKKRRTRLARLQEKLFEEFAF
jgi:hypothetical protein